MYITLVIYRPSGEPARAPRARVAGCKGKGTTFSSVGRFVRNKYVYLSSRARLIDLAGSRRLCGKVEAETGLPEVAWQHF